MILHRVEAPMRCVRTTALGRQRARAPGATILDTLDNGRVSLLLQKTGVTGTKIRRGVGLARFS
jgi:hypothetical protein